MAKKREVPPCESGKWWRWLWGCGVGYIQGSLRKIGTFIFMTHHTHTHTQSWVLGLFPSSRRQCGFMLNNFCKNFRNCQLLSLLSHCDIHYRCLTCVITSPSNCRRMFGGKVFRAIVEFNHFFIIWLEKCFVESLLGGALWADGREKGWHCFVAFVRRTGSGASWVSLRSGSSHYSPFSRRKNKELYEKKVRKKETTRRSMKFTILKFLINPLSCLRREHFISIRLAGTSIQI